MLIYSPMSYHQVEVEDEKEEVIVKKKEVKKSKSWGRRSTRAKKNISYRYMYRENSRGDKTCLYNGNRI